jgi:hypothetical protein
MGHFDEAFRLLGTTAAAPRPGRGEVRASTTGADIGLSSWLR